MLKLRNMTNKELARLEFSRCIKAIREARQSANLAAKNARLACKSAEEAAAWWHETERIRLEISDYLYLIGYRQLVKLSSEDELVEKMAKIIAGNDMFEWDAISLNNQAWYLNIAQRLLPLITARIEQVKKDTAREIGEKIDKFPGYYREIDGKYNRVVVAEYIESLKSRYPGGQK